MIKGMTLLGLMGIAFYAITYDLGSPRSKVTMTTEQIQEKHRAYYKQSQENFWPSPQHGVDEYVEDDFGHYSDGHTHEDYGNARRAARSQDGGLGLGVKLFPSGPSMGIEVAPNIIVTPSGTGLGFGF